MAALPTPKPTTDKAKVKATATVPVDAAIAAFAPALPLAIGLSGGADSTALLLACARRWPGQVSAIHVHHGLQAAADGFEQHCHTLCAQLQIPLTVQRVDARPAQGQSPEDAARIARYHALDAAIARQAPPPAAIALAQHADDQVETILLALSRGAGVAGLAAMPAQWQRGSLGLTWHRPLLRVSSAAIRQWLSAQNQHWVEDPTNSDERYTRNRIRAQLLPALEAVFPAFRDTFARSASNAAQAKELLLALAEQDLLQVGQLPRIRALQALSPARQANVLRHWLLTSHHTTPSSAQLAQLQQQIRACTTQGHRIHLKVGRGFITRAGELLDWYN